MFFIVNNQVINQGYPQWHHRHSSQILYFESTWTLDQEGPFVALLDLCLSKNFLFMMLLNPVCIVVLKCTLDQPWLILGRIAALPQWSSLATWRWAQGSAYMMWWLIHLCCNCCTLYWHSRCQFPAMSHQDCVAWTYPSDTGKHYWQPLPYDHRASFW